MKTASISPLELRSSPVGLMSVAAATEPPTWDRFARGVSETLPGWWDRRGGSRSPLGASCASSSVDHMWRRAKVRASSALRVRGEPADSGPAEGAQLLASEAVIARDKLDWEVERVVNREVSHLTSGRPL